MEQLLHRARWRKNLASRRTATVAVIDPPRDYAAALGELPAGAELRKIRRRFRRVTLWFVRDPRGYQAGAARMRRKSRIKRSCGWYGGKAADKDKRG